MQIADLPTALFILIYLFIYRFWRWILCLPRPGTSRLAASVGPSEGTPSTLVLALYSRVYCWFGLPLDHRRLDTYAAAQRTSGKITFVYSAHCQSSLSSPRDRFSIFGKGPLLHFSASFHFPTFFPITPGSNAPTASWKGVKEWPPRGRV